MIVEMVNRYGRPQGNAIVPDAIFADAKRVFDWMQSNNVRELCGLTCDSVGEWSARYERKE
jgi:hypothetical protein